MATNRKAFFHYAIIDIFEAGIVLSGPEVKSLRLGNVSMEGSFARVANNEVFIHNLTIQPYEFNHVEKTDPARTRKLLFNAAEIKRLIGQTQIKGNTLIPLEIYFKGSWAKIKIGLAKGKNYMDKRDTIKKRDMAREVNREFKGNFKA